jgi:hypothetical protein
LEATLVYLLWVTAVIFTLATFIWRAQVLFPLLTSFFWLFTAYSMVQINYMGFGSTNPIIYSHELGDWYGDIELFYFLTGIGLIMLIYSFYVGLVLSKHDVELVQQGRASGFEDTRGWK